MIPQSTILTLRNINLNEAGSYYNQNNIGNLPLPKLSGSVVPAKKNLHNEIYSSDTQDPIFSINSKSENKIIIATNSCANPTREVLCWGGCGKMVRSDNVGIITDVKIKINIDGSIKYVISREGYTCSEQCSYDFSVEKLEKGSNCPYQYKNSKYYHELIHSVTKPEERSLVNIRNKDLLTINGGCFDDNQFQSKGFNFMRCPIPVVVKNTKGCYQSIH